MSAVKLRSLSVQSKMMMMMMMCFELSLWYKQLLTHAHGAYCKLNGSNRMLHMWLQEEKYVSCKIAEEEKTSVGLDCSVGNLFFNTLAKVYT